MSDDFDPNAFVPLGVATILDALERVTPSLDPRDRDTLAFNVLLNALGTVLERIREDDPEEHRVHLAMAQAILRDS